MNLKMVGLISKDLCVLRFMGAMRTKMPEWSHFDARPPEGGTPNRAGSSPSPFGVPASAGSSRGSNAKMRITVPAILSLDR
jgi:hypothetical protein